MWTASLVLTESVQSLTSMSSKVGEGMDTLNHGGELKLQSSAFITLTEIVITNE